jgi:hypothetical protein
MMRKVRNTNKVINLSELAKIKTNFPEADFWIIRQGSEDKVGSPTRKFCLFSIKICLISYAV